MNPKEKVNTYNIRSKSRLNTLPMSWGISKIHTKINFKWQIILEMSFMSNDEYIETENCIIALNKRSALDSIHQNHLGREGLGWNI